MKARFMLVVEEQELQHDHNKNSMTSHIDHSSSPHMAWFNIPRKGNSSCDNNRGGRNQSRGCRFDDVRFDSGQPTYRSLAKLTWPSIRVVPVSKVLPIKPIIFLGHLM
uniref:Uncharacterized protein n=1 Tax=Lactuca sativa TaxID=4236 RepID=A0A9R1VH14_LACSA|nr:hypothetical protein LSAT_V11C500268040 [Lactuca sativa]